MFLKRHHAGIRRYMYNTRTNVVADGVDLQVIFSVLHMTATFLIMMTRSFFWFSRSALLC